MSTRSSVPVSDADIPVLAAEIDGQLDVVAERARGRVEGLVALPRMAWAVSTDVATVRDMTADELALTPRTGETIEIAQWNIAKNESMRLLRVPAGEKEPAIPIEQVGQHFVTSPSGIFIAVVKMIDARQRTDQVKGLIGVAEKWDSAAVERRIESLAAKVRIETANGSFAWGAPPVPGSTDHSIIVALRAAAAPGARLVFTIAPPGASSWRGLVLSIGGAALILATALAFWRDRRAQAAVSKPRARPSQPKVASAKVTPAGGKTTPVVAMAATATPAAAGVSRAKWAGGGQSGPAAAGAAASKPREPAVKTVSSSQELPIAQAEAAKPDVLAASTDYAAPVGPAASAASAGRPASAGRAASAGAAVSAGAAASAPAAFADSAASDGRVTPAGLAVFAGSEASAFPTASVSASPTPTLPRGAAPPAASALPPAPIVPAVSPLRATLPRATLLGMRVEKLPPAEPSSAEVPMDHLGTERIVLGTANGTSDGEPATVIGEDWGETSPHVVETLRRLYEEFLALRRTCGERTDNVDYDNFVTTLRRRRQELIARHLFKEVTFRIAFNDGKAIVRSTGIR